ncbi:MAG: tetratricopeptide repeat protein [Treponema sp.]|nr:tetratricopeptide repeat protein [Treponema sp.]
MTSTLMKQKASRLLNTLMLENHVTFDDIYYCAEENKEKIKKMLSIFKKNNMEDEMLSLEIVGLLAQNDVSEVVDYYCKNYYISNDVKNKYNIQKKDKNIKLLLTACMCNPMFYYYTLDLCKRIKEKIKENKKNLGYYYITICEIKIDFPFYTGRTRKGNVSNKQKPNLNIQINENISKIKNNPDDYKALMNLAVLYLKSEDIDNAIKFASKVLEIKNETSLPALLVRGLAYYEIFDHYNALKDFEEITNINKYNLEVIVYYFIGSIHLREGRKEEAKNAFDKVKAIDPNFADVDQILRDFFDNEE